MDDKPAQPVRPQPVKLLQERYQIKNKISQGTYGQVYVAIDHVNNEEVALKKIIFHDENEGYPYTAIREINFLKKLNHPHIVKIKDVVAEPTKLNIVFEYLKCDLSSRIKDSNQPPLNRLEVKKLMYQLFLGLNKVHSARIIHRDIKPLNLLLAVDGTLKIADFGLARGMSLPERTFSEDVATLYYRAPEVILRMRYSKEMDIWSVGCVFYEMVTGKCLFQGDSEVDQLHRILRALGTPSIEDWPELNNVRNGAITAGNLPSYQKQPLKVTYPQLDLEDAGYDLMEKLLAVNPKNRITAEMAMQQVTFV